MSTHAAGRLRQPRNHNLALASGRQNQDSRILADKPIPTARREASLRSAGMGLSAKIFIFESRP